MSFSIPWLLCGLLAGPPNKSKFFLKRRKAPSIEKFQSPVFPLSRDYTGPIDVTYTNGPIDAWVEEHISGDVSLVGFDLESAPDLPWSKYPFVGPATVQIATPENVLVVQLFGSDGQPDDRAIPSIAKFLADRSVIKAGVGLDQDAVEAGREWDEIMQKGFQSRLDLRRVGTSADFRDKSLKELGRRFLGVDLEKSKTIARSNWASVPLDDRQLFYCARDAWVAAAVMHELSVQDKINFSPEAILRNYLQNETAVSELSERAATRREVKLQLKELPTDESELDGAQLLLKNDLQKKFWVLAPPRPPFLDIVNIMKVSKS